MYEIKRGLVMTLAPVATLVLISGTFTAGAGIYWVQALAAFLLICTCFLGAWSFIIGFIHLALGTITVLKAWYKARRSNA
jgi:hypothetical protein